MDSLEICVEYLNFSYFKGVFEQQISAATSQGIRENFYLVSDKIQIRGRVQNSAYETESISRANPA